MSVEANPYLALALTVFIAFFFTIGVISSLRWAIRSISARKTRKSIRRYATIPKPARVTTTTPTTFYPSKSEPFPLRNEAGPRDWEQKLRD